MKEPQVVARIAKVHAAKVNKLAVLLLQWHSVNDRDAWLKENKAVVLKKYSENVSDFQWEPNCGQADCYGDHKHYLAIVAGYMSARREIKLSKK